MLAPVLAAGEGGYRTISGIVCGASRCVGTPGGGSDAAVSRGSTRSCVTVCGTLASAEEVGGGVSAGGASGSMATCTEVVGVAADAVAGESTAVGVEGADLAGADGDSTISAGCWTVSTPAPARRLRVRCTRPRRSRSETIGWVKGNRPTIPVTARRPAVAVTPHHQRGREL